MTAGHPHSADVAPLIDRYDAALNAHDRDAIASMHDDAIVFHNHTARERVAGATAGRAHIGAPVSVPVGPVAEKFAPPRPGHPVIDRTKTDGCLPLRGHSASKRSRDARQRETAAST